MMPVIDGFEFLSIVKAQEQWKTIPVIVITSKDLTLEERAWLMGGAKEIIQKGLFNPEKFCKIVSEQLNEIKKKSYRSFQE